MSDSYGFDDSSSLADGDLQDKIDKTTGSTNALGTSISQFSTLITRAFSQAVTGGKQFDDVLKNVTLSLSKLAVQSAFKSVTQGLSGSVEQTDSGGTLTITPFASGGVIGAPSYFPTAGGLGLAGEAGPEAIMPLSRGSDGRLGVAGGGTTASSNITVQIATPDTGSFQRSEAYVTGQIARAVSRGQRGL